MCVKIYRVYTLGAFIVCQLHLNKGVSIVTGNVLLLAGTKEIKMAANFGWLMNTVVLQKRGERRRNRLA